MPQPLAVYASTVAGAQDWTAGTTPVVVTSPFEFWPDLTTTLGIPTGTYLEIPEYLWNVNPPPNAVDIQVFRRTLTATTGVAFGPTEIPTGAHDFVITHAADDFYTLNVYTGQGGTLTLVPPSPVSTDPVSLAWRNVKAYSYTVTGLGEGQTIVIETIAKQLGPYPVNPAMFTWVLQFFS